MPAPDAPIRLTLLPGLQPLPPAGANGYFDALVAGPNCVYSRSCRSQAQLDALVAAPVSTAFTYSPLTDTYPLRQDAAKLVIPAGGWDGAGSASLPGTQQVRFALPTYTDGSIILTWDWYWGPELVPNMGGVINWKAFQVEVAGHGWWTLMQSPGVMGSTLVQPQCAVITDEIRSTPLVPAAGLITPERVTPSGLGTLPQTPTYLQAFRIMHSRWTRYWVEVNLFQPASAFVDWNATYGVTLQPNASPGSNGTWHMVSEWIADEQRPAARVLFRVPMDFTGPRAAATPWSGKVDRFRFEQNTSKKNFVGPWIGYGKNVALLRNILLPAINPEASLFFQQPQAT